MNAKIDTINKDAMLRTEEIMEAVDILTHVTSSIDYLEDVADKRISSLLTILHQEIDRSLLLLKGAGQV